MSLSSDELWQRLLREGLATPEQCQQWAHELLPRLSETDAKNGLKLLLQLIAAGRLSKYQAKIIAGQASGPIRYGPWTVEHPVKLPMWQGWYEVRRGHNDRRWARPVSAAELEQLRPLRPSLPRALKLSSIPWDDLITGQPPELIDGTLLVFIACSSAAPQPAIADAPTPQSSDAPRGTSKVGTSKVGTSKVGIPQDGKLLSQEFANQRCPLAAATRIVGRLAEILAGLHGKQLIHGRVLPDRIYLQGERVALAIDPLCTATGLPEPPTTTQPNAPAHANAPAQANRAAQALDSLNSGLIGSSLQIADVSSFCAPELWLPEPLPSMSSDVFSLGSVWWWLLTGQPLNASPSSTTRKASASQLALRLPADCRLPEPLWRCLQACLAHNPSSRFASAAELQRALAVAQRARPIAAAQPAQPVAVERPQQQQQPTTKQPVPTEQPRSAEQQPAASVGSHTAVPAAAIEIPRRRRRRQGIPWLWPILGGCGVLIGLLVILKLTGALQPSAESQQASAKRPAAGSPPDLGTAPAIQTTTIAADPRSEHFEIVAVRPAANQRGLWAPPNAPDPLPLDLLPPGGQVFLSLRPDQWPSMELPIENSGEIFEEASVAWPAILGEQIAGLAQQLHAMAGVPLADVAQVTLSFYAAEQSGQPPRVCARLHLNRPQPLSELTAAWNEPAREDVSQQQLWVVNPQRAYYVPGRPQAGAATTTDTTAAVSDFSVGPVDMMREVAELEGAPGPLLPHLEKLWNSTDQTADVSLLISTPFLFSDGRDLLQQLPSRLHPTLKQWLGGDVRGASMHVHWQPVWYLETRVAGSNDMDAGKILARQQQQVEALPASVEQWLVSHTVHPYWRALALRYPQMLRTFVDYTRFGVEHGTALMNGYLPSQGGSNLTLTSWIALQDYAALGTAGTVASSPAGGGAAPVPGDPLPVDIEAYLSQLIQLSFDQEPIEVALQAVADEANAKLPAGTKPLRFVLNGAAFGKAGITRNQQLSDFRIEQQSVRDALTEIARRGNPVTTVTDLRHEDQRLLWIVAPDPESASGAAMISLTTRAAAKESGHDLPREFAPAP